MCEHQPFSFHCNSNFNQMDFSISYKKLHSNQACQLKLAAVAQSFIIIKRRRATYIPSGSQVGI